MKKIFLSILTAIMFVGVTASPALAAKPSSSSKPSGGGGGTTVSTVGYDVSYPQCGRSLPTDQAFGIVGVNGGKATTTNPCLSDQLVWANQSSGVVKAQPKVQLYVNTANPGEVIYLVDTWPTDNYDLNGDNPDNKYGNTCAGDNDLSCSWLYGWNRALDASENRFAPAALTAKISDVTADYTWWLDVETMNTWQEKSDDALRRNVATLEGMTSYFISQGVENIGLYSTAYQWGVITGNFIGLDSNLNGLPNWRPSGASLKNAKNNCKVPSLTTGGYISLTQYVVRNLDNNYSCN